MQSPLPPAAAPPLAPVVPSVATSRPPPQAPAPPVFDENLLAIVCGRFTIGPLIDFPAMGRKLMRVKYTVESTTNYYFAYLSQSEGMFRVFFVLNPAGGIEKGIDYVQATLLEICLQYYLNKLHNELLNLPPRNIRTAQELGEFIKNMSGEDPKQYIKIRPGFNPFFSRVSNDFKSQQLDLPLMYYFTTVGLIYGNGLDQVRSFSELVYDPNKKALLKFLQDGISTTEVPPVLDVLTGAFLYSSDYAASGKYKNELVTCKKYKNELNFNNGAPDLGNMVHNMDLTSYLAHVPSETIRWNMDAMRSNTRLRNRLLPDNYEQLAIFEMQLLILLLTECSTPNKWEDLKPIPYLKSLNVAFVDLLSRLLIQPGTIGGLTCQILTNGIPLPEVQKLLGLELQKILGVDQIDQRKFIDLIIFKIRNKFQILSVCNHLLLDVTCDNLSLMQKIVKFITELKMMSDPLEKLEKYNLDPHNITSFDIQEIRDLFNNCYITIDEFGKKLDWIKEWFNLWERLDINAANEILQRITEGIGAVNKGRGVDEIKINLLEEIINVSKTINLKSVCYSIFLVASFLMIIQDKISTEISFPTPSQGSTCLNIYKGVLNNAIIRRDVIDLLTKLAESILTPDSPRIKEILDLIESKHKAITATIALKDRLKQDMAQKIQGLLERGEFPYNDSKFKEKVESLLVPVAPATPPQPRSITEDMYQQSKLFKNYAENENFTKRIFESEYGIDSLPTVKLYCYGTKKNDGEEESLPEFQELNKDPVSDLVSIIPGIASVTPTIFNSSFDNWYFDVPQSSGNAPHNATVFTVSVIYALELLYTMNYSEDITDHDETTMVPTVEETDINNQPAKKQAVMVGGETQKKICILFTVSSTIVLPLPIPYTITESDIKFAIQNQITPIACIPYDDASLDINTIRKTLLGTYPRFSIYGTAFAGKPMDYVIGQHEQLPVFFKTDTYFSKYLKVCEHYCTTAPFYNWCNHKPYSYLDIGTGLPFAEYFVQLFSAEGDYASLGLNFNMDMLANILVNRTSMVEAITRLYTDGCSFFEMFNDPDEVVKSKEVDKSKEEKYLCEKASYEDEICERQVVRRKVPTLVARRSQQQPPKKILKAIRPSAALAAAALAADDGDGMSGTLPAEDNTLAAAATDTNTDTNTMEIEGGSTSRQRQTFKRRQQGGNRTFKRHPRHKHKRKHNDDGLTKHKTSNKLRRKKSVKN
jgi:hypothetical protein